MLCFPPFSDLLCIELLSIVETSMSIPPLHALVYQLTQDLASSTFSNRLVTGAKVKEVELAADGRLCYELVSGIGPANGWVTVNLKGKDLLVKLPVDVKETETTKESEASTEGEEVEQVEAESNESESPKVVSSEKDDKKPSEEEKEAFKQYLEKFGENRSGGNPGYNRKSFPWAVNHAAKRATPKEAIEAALAAKPKPTTRRPAQNHVDSDGEEVPLCTRCHMPVGEFAYEGRQGRGSCVHAECMAQILVEDAQRQEDRRAGWENEKKLRSRKEYDIGWRMDSVPQNGPLAMRLGCQTTSRGMCCLVLDEASRTVKIAPTLEPAAAVNLEYLLLALKVRKTASREPLFSLDPVDPPKPGEDTAKEGL